MDTPNVPLTPLQPRRRWRRRLLIGLGVMLLLLLLPVGLYVYLDYCAEAEVRAAIAEIEANDPHWRLEDIEATRAVIPDEENSALVVQTAWKALPAGWSNKAVYQKIGTLAPPFRLDPGHAKVVQGDLGLLTAPLTEARKLAKLPRGRYAIFWAKDLISTRLDHCQQSRALAELLNIDAMLRADAGDFGGAWESAQAILNAARSFGDEPVALSTLVRIAVRAVAIGSLQRTLAQGQVPEAALAETQKLFDDEAAQRLLLTVARGERAWQHELFVQIETGEFSPQQLMSMTQSRVSASDKFSALFLRGTARQSHAWSLRSLTQEVESARRPPAEQLQATMVVPPVSEAPALARMMIPALQKIGEGLIREQARVDCARAALAAERYRLKEQRWPEGLAALVRAGLLSEVPIDPYDGQPLRFRRTADGLVVYSIGPDKSYRGDALDDIWNWGPTKVRVEFRLWDPPQRGQPAPPPRGEADDSVNPMPPSRRSKRQP